MSDEVFSDLMGYIRKIYSRTGEDGILVEIFHRLGIERGIFCEFGAWDGVNISNCRALFDAGWRGTFIEADAERFRKLEENYADHKDRILTLNHFIDREGENSLDVIFGRNDITELDLLSIDIDGDDLAVWRSLTVLRPRVVIIEYNHTIPFDVRYENPLGRQHGNDAFSILEHAESMEYDLIGFVEHNLIFIDRVTRPASLPVISRARFFEEGWRERFFSVYDGTILHQTNDGQIHEGELIWISYSDVYFLQPIPRRWRTFEGSSFLAFYRRRNYFTFVQAFLMRPVAVARDPELRQLLFFGPLDKLLGHRARKRARQEGKRRVCSDESEFPLVGDWSGAEASEAPPDLMRYARSIHSQHGEDGILAEIFRRLGVSKGTFCEFGAWDGIYASTCRALFEVGWGGIFIESKEGRFRQLEKNYAEHKGRILTLNHFIDREGENSLDAIFARHGITSLDFLSIDMGSDDLALWRSLTTLRPGVVAIEYNFGIPFDVRYENPLGKQHSNGALSILEHAEATGYDFVAFEGQDLIFCDRTVRPDSLPVISRARFFDEGKRDRLFVGHDGTILQRTTDGKIYDREIFRLSHAPGYLLQPIPGFLRGFDVSVRHRRFRRYFILMQMFFVRPLSVVRDSEFRQIFTSPVTRLRGHRARKLAREAREAHKPPHHPDN
ncbi:MAG: FkbM family methyltransferase [Alphaproteobacteria bacterium]